MGLILLIIIVLLLMEAIHLGFISHRLRLPAVGIAWNRLITSGCYDVGWIMYARFLRFDML